MEEIRGTFKARCRKLSKQIDRLDLETLPAREEIFKDIAKSIRQFQEALDIWEDSLPRDDQQEIIYPEQGAPGGAYNEEL